MEKNNGSRLIAVLALVVAVAGLSLGFAAFSTTLKVDTAANVTAGSNWNIGFSTDGTNIEDVTTAGTVNANETGNPGVIDVTKYTIAQNTNATLSTTTGSSVSYDLKILNKGTLPARLESVNFGGVAVTCTNATASATPTLIEGVAGAGTTSTGGNTSTISNADCAKMFRATLKIGSTTYSSTPASIPSSEVIAAGGNADVKLTVEYIDDADARAVAATLDGDIVVNIGSISVGYTSTSGS
ncbi:MAG: hypothetical protein IJ572_03285 [Bacilli bacterium]|nr:hypothetical protein [Bacilli bacterium]